METTGAASNTDEIGRIFPSNTSPTGAVCSRNTTPRTSFFINGTTTRVPATSTDYVVGGPVPEDRADLLAIIVGPDAPIPHEDVARLKSRLEAVRPGVSVTLVALNFCAKEDRTTGSLDEGLLVRDMTRELHAYDFVKTSWEWDFLEDVKLSGKIAAMKDEKRNATKGMSFWYRIHRKLFLHCKKVLERSNAHVK